MAPVFTPGSIKLFTVTTGVDLDATGYTIELCCQHSSFGDFATIRDIGINTFGGFSNLAPGTYTLTLGAIASNCFTPNNPRTVTVTAGATTETTFNVTCGALPTTGSIRVKTVTTGESLDPNGYTVTTSKTINLPIGINTSTTISGFTPGVQSVQIGDIAPNCATTNNLTKELCRNCKAPNGRKEDAVDRISHSSTQAQKNDHVSKRTRY